MKRTRLTPFVAVASLSLLFGCQKQDTSTPLSTRLESALAIQEVARKDSNLRGIALDAAKADEREICKKAVRAMQTAAMADDTAADCLRTFRKAGKPDAAVEMAKLIQVDARRDMWLSELSK